MPKIQKELKICEAKTDKSLIDEPPEVELKDLPPHLEYAFLEGDNKLPVIIAKDLSVEEKAALIKVLKSHKRAIAWKLSDIKGINLEFCTHKILMEEDYKLAVQHQIQITYANMWSLAVCMPFLAYAMHRHVPKVYDRYLTLNRSQQKHDGSHHGDDFFGLRFYTAPKQQQQVIPQTTDISNIKLLILKKEEYDIWAMEMEQYLEYIDNDVWKVIQNENSKKRISTGKDGVIRILPPVTAAEIQAIKKERKAKNILLMAIPKENMRRFHGMDDAKEIWEAIRTRFGGNANSKKMQKAVFKQQFEAFTISSSEGLEKGYDRFQQLLSQLEDHGAEVSTEDENHKFLRSLPLAWSNLAMTMRTKSDVDTLSIDDLYNNLRVFLLGFTYLMRQKNKIMKQEGLIQHYGILEDLKSNSSYLLI
ncbi:hypothetical protein Tco_1330373 [Tanacetum coccineum]